MSICMSLVQMKSYSTSNSAENDSAGAHEPALSALSEEAVKA